jgi:diadenylate cyclase
MCGEICWTFETQFNGLALLDVLIVALLFFFVSVLLRGSQALSLLRGVLIVSILVGLTLTIVPLTALRWMITNLLPLFVLAIPVIFQPELRRALERVGRAGFSSRDSTAEAEHQKMIAAICAATARLSERRHGALIVLERDTNLQEFIDTGIGINSQTTAQLLLTIFYPKTELHDGAVIIRSSRIAAAAAVLPLSAGKQLGDRKLGTRHRAALGISEIGDSVCIVVSEETGQISVANGGRMIRKLDATRLQTVLQAFYGTSMRGRRNRLMQRDRDAATRERERDRENIYESTTP